MKRWLRRHDAEIAGLTLYFACVGWAWWEDEDFLHEMVYTHMGAAFGTLLAVWFIKYFWERVDKPEP